MTYPSVVEASIVAEPTAARFCLWHESSLTISYSVMTICKDGFANVDFLAKI